MAQVDRQYIERLAQERFQGEYRNRFLEALDQVAADIDLDNLATLIEAGRVEAAVQAVGLSPAAFEGMAAVTSTAVAASARETAKIVPPRDAPDGSGKVRFTFRVGNPRAEAAVNDLNTELMRGLRGGPGITTEGANAIREHIRAGLREGKNPRDIARRIRGTWDSQTRTFKGGILGLTDRQSQHVRNAERQLRSGDPTELRKYLGRKLRDKRFDRSVLKAIREGTPLPERTIKNATDAYTRKYTNFRAETIARDQALSALSEGQQQALDQAVEDGHVTNNQIVQEWVTARDDRVRNAHRAIPGMNPGGRRRGETFDTPLGPLRYPRDPRGRAANTINCRCSLAPRIIDDRTGVNG